MITLLLRIALCVLHALHGRVSAGADPAASETADIIAECIYMLRDAQAAHSAPRAP